MLLGHWFRVSFLIRGRIRRGCGRQGFILLLPVHEGGDLLQGDNHDRHVVVAATVEGLLHNALADLLAARSRRQQPLAVVDRILVLHDVPKAVAPNHEDAVVAL
eukprot:223668_1